MSEAIARLQSHRRAPRILFWSTSLANSYVDNCRHRIRFQLREWNNDLGFEHDCFYGCVNHLTGDVDPFGVITFQNTDVNARRFLAAAFFLCYSFDWAFVVLIDDERIRIEANDEYTWFYGSRIDVDALNVNEIATLFGLPFET